MKVGRYLPKPYNQHAELGLRQPLLITVKKLYQIHKITKTLQILTSTIHYSGPLNKNIGAVKNITKTVTAPVCLSFCFVVFLAIFIFSLL